MTLPGPSRTIIVEPVEQPARPDPQRDPAPVPEPRQPAPERAPVPAREREDEPVPVAP